MSRQGTSNTALHQLTENTTTKYDISGILGNYGPIYSVNLIFKVQSPDFKLRNFKDLFGSFKTLFGTSKELSDTF